MFNEKKRVLITVKAYPNQSNRYKEVVCAAGIDIEKKEWVRLFPIPYRYLDQDKQFKKYSIIEVDATRSPADKRPESYKIRIDSIKVLEHLDTRKNWVKRKSFILPLANHSLCEIMSRSISENMSLGMFKPDNISFDYEKANKKNIQKKIDAAYIRPGFLNERDISKLELIPYHFRYHFKCKNEARCPGHTLPIID